MPHFAQPSHRQQLWKAAVLLVLVAWLYLPILLRLAQQCWNDANWSHALVVPIFSMFVLWRQRDQLIGLTASPSMWGVPVLLLAMGTLGLGVLGAELFLSRFSLLLLLAGLIVLFMGWRYFRSVLFPWAFLILMIPIPAILLNQITSPLQVLASKFAATVLPVMGVPVLREGNVIHLPAISLEVAEACSGIRSLLSLVTLAIIYGFLAETRKPVRLLLGLAAIPIAVLANGLRIVGTGVLAEYWDPRKAQGFFHTFSGWLIFLLSLVSFVVLHRVWRMFGVWYEGRPHAV